MNRIKEGKFRKGGKSKLIKRREYVIKIKERQVRKGKGANVKKTTKYTGRRRKPKFWFLYFFVIDLSFLIFLNQDFIDQNDV